MSADPKPEGWTEVQVVVPADWAELVAEALAVEPCTSVAFGPPSLASAPPAEGTELLRTYVPAREDGPETRAAIAARLAALGEAVGAPELVDLRPSFRELPPEDYATSWRKVWRPFRVGRLCVLGSGAVATEHPPLRATDVPLRFEPLSSFGTGRHATTRTCLRVLQERPVQGARVLDAGTGSGILAVTAAIFGARGVIGFDIDPESASEARELAERNGVSAGCTFRRGGFDVLTDEDAEFDVALANIYSDVIQETAPDLAARLRPGGWFAFSGCPADKVAPTREAIQAAGLVVEEDRRRGRWHTFVGTRPGR